MTAANSMEDDEGMRLRFEEGYHGFIITIGKVKMKILD